MLNILCFIYNRHHITEKRLLYTSLFMLLLQKYVYGVKEYIVEYIFGQGQDDSTVFRVKSIQSEVSDFRVRCLP